MPNTIEQTLRSITDDRRADWLFETKPAADAVGCHPRKFGDWWHRTRQKLLDLYEVQPGQVAAEFMAIIAAGEARRQSNEQK